MSLRYYYPNNTLSDPRVVKSQGGGMCPEQHWGELTNGWSFYFRLRHGGAQLHVGPPGTDAGELPRINPEFDETLTGQSSWPSLYLEPFTTDVPYPGTDLGVWLSDEDRDEWFTRCLDRVWGAMR